MRRASKVIIESRQIAGFSTCRQELIVGGLRVPLLTVGQLEDYVDAGELLRNPDAPEPPYWAHLWPGSRVLARLVATEIECRNRRAIDIGCGVGLVGVVAARRGAAVTVIDTAPAALCFARANAARNGCEVAAIRTDVRRAGVRGPFDYCFAADVTYDPVLQGALADFLAAHLAAGGRAWCAESVRTFDHGFRRACEARGFEVTERTFQEPDDGRTVSVRLTA
ncbi:MAG TPA: methyltransferase, partial [Candidatus Acidoferrales bacterium]|nr:methyltransferase [Candidatus Acidoferrales bacterium]